MSLSICSAVQFKKRARLIHLHKQVGGLKRRIMAAPLVGKRVTVNGIAGRAELNGRTGVAESFNDANGVCCHHESSQGYFLVRARYKFTFRVHMPGSAHTV